MVTVSGENTVKCLEGFREKQKPIVFWQCQLLSALEKFSGFLLENLRLSLDMYIFDSLWTSSVVFRILRQSSGIFVNLRKSSENRKLLDNDIYHIDIPNIIILLAFLEPSFWKKFYCYGECFTVRV